MYVERVRGWKMSKRIQAATVTRIARAGKPYLVTVRDADNRLVRTVKIDGETLLDPAEVQRQVFAETGEIVELDAAGWRDRVSVLLRQSDDEATPEGAELRRRLARLPEAARALVRGETIQDRLEHVVDIESALATSAAVEKVAQLGVKPDPEQERENRDRAFNDLASRRRAGTVK